MATHHVGHDLVQGCRQLICRTCSNERNVAYRARLREKVLQDDPIGHKRTLRPAEVRFWRLVDRSDSESCWPWLGAVFEQAGGYGAFTLKYPKVVRAHRVSFFFTYGRWPIGMLLHSCDNPPCVNPLHLREGSAADNSADAKAKGRHAHGERIGSAKLTSALVMEIRLADLLGAEWSYLAQRYGVSESTIADAILRRTWAHVP